MSSEYDLRGLVEPLGTPATPKGLGFRGGEEGLDGPSLHHLGLGCLPLILTVLLSRDANRGYKNPF